MSRALLAFLLPTTARQPGARQLLVLLLEGARLTTAAQQEPQRARPDLLRAVLVMRRAALAARPAMLRETPDPQPVALSVGWAVLPAPRRERWGMQPPPPLEQLETRSVGLATSGQHLAWTCEMTSNLRQLGCRLIPFVRSSASNLMESARHSEGFEIG
jgi:hypothetical protein